MHKTDNNNAVEILEGLFECRLPESVAAQIRDWYFGSADRERKDEALRQMWETLVVERPRYDSDMYRRYAALCQRIGIVPLSPPAARRTDMQPVERHPARRPAATPDRRRRRLIIVLAGAAAAAVLAAVVAIGYLTPLDRGAEVAPDAPTAMMAVKSIVETAAGERMNVVLACGSQVSLAENSRLSYEEGARAVELVGEAFFTVTKDERRPFTVTTDALEVTVHGTEFLVDDHSDGRQATVRLFSGAVSLNGRECNARQVMLSPGETFAVEKSSGEWQVAKAEEQVPRWVDNTRTLTTVNFEQIAARIEREFGVRVVDLRANPADTQYYFTITEGMGVREAMDLLVRLDGNMSYRIVGDTVEIY
jgi:ferric-dicitrate binding protein FerR (iron transport regulator)